MRATRTVARGLLSATVAMGFLAAGLATPAHASRWLAPQRLIDPVGYATYPTAVGMNAAGASAVAFVVRTPAGKAGVYVATRAAGAPSTTTAPRGFPAATRVNVESDVRALGVIVDDAGGTTVMWMKTLLVYEGDGAYSDHDGEVYTAYKPAGGEWQAAQLVGANGWSYGDRTVGRVQIAARPNGGAIVLGDGWIAQRPSGAVRFNASKRFGETGIGQWTPNFGDSVSSMNARGDIAVAYSSPGVVSDDLFFTILPAGGTWTQPYELVGGSEAFSTRVAMTDSGRAAVAWTTTYPGIRVQSAVRIPGVDLTTGSWSETITHGGTSASTAVANGLKADGRSTANLLYTETFPDTGNSYPFEFRLPGWVGIPYSDPPSPTSPYWDQNFDDIWAENASGAKVVLPFNTPGGAIGARVKNGAGVVYSPLEIVLSPVAPAFAYSNTSVALDSQGNGFVAWVRRIGTTPETQLVGVSGFDPAPPTLGTVTVPSTATVGAAATLSGAATDRMSNVKLAWDFGDSTTGTGGSVTHAWSKAGTFTVKLTATDDAGNVSTSTKSIVVSLPKLDTKPALITSVQTGGKTLVKSLELSGVKSGDSVKLTCTGTGCSSTAQRTFTIKAAAAKLVTPFGASGAGISLSPGAVLTVVVGRTAYAAQTVRWTMVAGKAPTKS